MLYKYQYKNEWFYYSEEIINIWNECKNTLDNNLKLHFQNPKKLLSVETIIKLKGKERILKSLEYIQNNTKCSYRIKILLYLCDFVQFNSGTMNISQNFKKEISSIFNIDYSQVC